MTITLDVVQQELLIALLQGYKLNLAQQRELIPVEIALMDQRRIEVDTTIKENRSC
jgi:hypothetical protein